MRAAAENFTMARMLGVRANRVIMLAFAVSGMLAAAIGLILVTQTGTVDINMGANLMLVAFVATVIGGLGSLPGAVLATLLWALGSAAFSLYVSDFATYDAMYGPLGATVGLLMWFYVSVYVVLLGAELNVALATRAGAW